MAMAPRQAYPSSGDGLEVDSLSKQLQVSPGTSEQESVLPTQTFFNFETRSAGTPAA